MNVKYYKVVIFSSGKAISDSILKCKSSPKPHVLIAFRLWYTVALFIDDVILIIDKNRSFELSLAKTTFNLKKPRNVAADQLFLT